MKIITKLKKIIEHKNITEISNKTGFARSTIYRTLNKKTKLSYDFCESIENLYKEVIAENKKAG